MSRLFLSHSSLDLRQAVALKQWLVNQEPALANEIFVDVDPEVGLQPGQRWKDALQRATARCEAVICLLSANWEASHECRVEYRVAENLNKQILCARLEPSAGDGLTAEWQRCDLFGDGAKTKIELDGGPPVEFATDGLYRLRDAIRGAGISALSFVWPPPGDPDRAPYRGWQPFEPVDAAVFFGRDAAIVRALDELRGMRLTGVRSLFVVLGPSGAGKSSFLRAGLLPRLAREDRRFVLLGTVRPGRQALTGDTGLAVAIRSTREKLGLSQPSLGEIKTACTGDVGRVRDLLVEIQQAAAARLPAADGGDEKPDPPTLILPLDQAEELFSADAGAQGPQLLALINSLTDKQDGTGLGLITAATIRTDRYEVMQTHPELAGIETRVFDDLKPMPPTQFKEIITGPAQRATEGGHRLEVAPDLVQRLLVDAAEGADTLPMLSLTLARLYADYGSSGELTTEQYEAMGGMHQVVQTEIDEILSADPTERQRQLDCLHAAFVPWLATINPDNDQPMRRVAKWDELPEQSRPLIDQMVAKRLMVKDHRDGQVVVEVALESLLRRWEELAGWLHDQRDNLKIADELERAESAWRTNRQDPAWLLTGTRLADAESLIGTHAFAQRLSPVRLYLAESRQAENERIRAEEEHRQAELRNAQERQATAEAHSATLRKRSRITAAIAVLTAVVAVVALVAFGQARNARSQAQNRFFEATSARLVSDAQGAFARTRPGGDVRGFQLLTAADSIAASPASSALYSAVVKNVDLHKVIAGSAPVVGVASGLQRFATATREGTIQIWDSGTGQPVGVRLTGHTGEVWSVAFSPDGSRIVSSGADQTVRVWDANSGAPVGDPLTGHTDVVVTAAFSPDGTRIASAGRDGTVRAWDADSGQPVGAPLTGHTPWAVSVAFSSDGSRIVSGGGGDHTVRLWDANTGQPVGAAMVGHTGDVQSVAFSPDGSRIVSGSADQSVRVWDANSGQPVGVPLTGHADWVTGVAFSPDGTRIVSGSRDQTVRVWDANSGQPVGAPLTGHTDWVTGVGFSPDGARIESGSSDQTVRVWDPYDPLTGHAGAVMSAAFSPDGSRIVSGGGDSTVRMWDVDSRQPVGAPMEHDGVESVAFSPDGSRIVSGGHETVRVWDAGSGEPVGDPLAGHTGAVKSVAFSPDGTRIVSGGYDHTVRVWDAGTGRPVGDPLTGHTGTVTSVAFSPDGTRIVSGGYDQTVRVWDANSGDPVGDPLAGHAYVVDSVAFSPDGTRIVSGSADQTLRVWDADSGEPVGDPLTGHTGDVTSVAFSPDGTRIVSAGVDQTVRVWDAESGEPVVDPLIGHTDVVESVAFSPDGTRIVSGSTDGTLRVWPGVARASDLCDKLTNNMSREQWSESVSPDIDYVEVCPDLPTAPEM
ncbi:nSTAND1 domain-containing NTPase [Mycolicibacterium sp. XJ870]